MAKSLKGGFRLHLREPLESQLDSYCKENFRNKTELIRELVTAYLAARKSERDRRRDRPDKDK